MLGWYAVRLKQISLERISNLIQFLGIFTLKYLVSTYSLGGKVIGFNFHNDWIMELKVD